jgi:hypothetical protein
MLPCFENIGHSNAEKWTDKVGERKKLFYFCRNADSALENVYSIRVNFLYFL